MSDDVAATGAVVNGIAHTGEVPAWRLDPVRLGVYQPWTASMDEGWARWVLEAYGQPYTTLQTPDIRQGGFGERCDALLIPEMTATDLLTGRPEKTREKDPYPPEYLGGIGEAGAEMLRRFVAEGGTLIACDGGASAIVDAMALPVEQPLRDAPVERFSCPGSLLRVVIDTAHPLGWGLPRELAVLFLNSVVFAPGGPEATAVARYPHANPRLSGWIHGAKELEGRSALVEVRYGEGRVVLCGFRPWFRAQARGTYRVLFNAIFRAGLSEDAYTPEA